MSKTSKELVFNVLEYEWNTRKPSYYNVIPYFKNNWNSKKFNFEKEKVKDKETLKEWIERASRYQFWARCEYEFLMGPWPYRDSTLVDDLKKIDVHEQIMMNIDVLTELLYSEFKLDKKKKTVKE
jgi:hypothetical protein